MVKDREVALRRVCKSLRKRLTQIRLSDENGVERDALYGQCVENADFLSQELQDEFPDSDIYIVHGGLDFDFDPTPKTYEDAKKMGNLHHWVVIKFPDGTQYHCNIQKEGGPYNAAELVSRTPPDSYIEFYRKKC